MRTEAREIIAAGGYRDQASANEPQRGPHTLKNSCKSVGLCIRHLELTDFVVSFDALDAKSPATRAQVSNPDTTELCKSHVILLLRTYRLMVC